MNKTTNQYINQLNLDPKREAAVRKLVEGAGGVSDSTPLVESLVGNELIPIKQDGENKAVSVEQIKNNVLAISSKYEFVDLGLPSGTKWATCNIGANSPEESGLYFAWGETEGYTAEDVAASKKAFSWNDYKFGTQYNLTKYNATDGLTQLELTDDAAYQSDNTCRMPSKDEIQELINNTTSTWETLNGVNGERFTSNINGNSIFVPAASYYENGSNSFVGSNGSLWSSSLGSDNWSGKYLSVAISLDADMYGIYRNHGLPIRPVQPANTPTTINLKELQDKVDSIEIQAKDAKEVYHLDINNYSTPEDFNNLKDAIDNNKLIKVKHNGGLFDVVYHEGETLDNNQITLFFGANWVNIGSNRAYYPTITGNVYVFFEDGTCVKVFQDKPSDITFNISGDGTKFLADDGEYKEVGPYIWNGTTSETIFNELKAAVENNRRIVAGGITFEAIIFGLYIYMYAECIDRYGKHIYQYKVNSTAVTSYNYLNALGSSGIITVYSNTYNILAGTNSGEPIDGNYSVQLNNSDTIAEEYQGEFSFGDTVYTVTFPDDIKWSTDSVLEYKANHTYQFKIVNKLGVMKEFANS